jgi:4-hydroxy-4-methyl-2-oxoglutarate aldolase
MQAPLKRQMLTHVQRNQILRFDTCKIANALEHLDVRLKNEGFTKPGLHCVTGGFPIALGHAVTCKVRAADPPMKGFMHVNLADWWERIASHPGPSIAIIQDVDRNPGQGAMLSDVHGEILRALDCCAVITNGAVRDVPALTAMGVPVFSQFIAASHSYVHMLDFEVPVEVLGLHVKPRDLVLVDVHGAVLLPPDAIDDMIRVAEEQSAQERIIIDLCRSSRFSMQTLRSTLDSMREQS